MEQFRRQVLGKGHTGGVGERALIRVVVIVGQGKRWLGR